MKTGKAWSGGCLAHPSLLRKHENGFPERKMKKGPEKRPKPAAFVYKLCGLFCFWGKWNSFRMVSGMILAISSKTDNMEMSEPPALQDIDGLLSKE